MAEVPERRRQPTVPLFGSRRRALKHVGVQAFGRDVLLDDLAERRDVVLHSEVAVQNHAVGARGGEVDPMADDIGRGLSDEVGVVDR